MKSEMDASAEDRVRAAMRTLASEANHNPTRPMAPHPHRTQAPRPRVRYSLVAAAAAALVGIVGVAMMLRDTPDDVTVDPSMTTTTGATSGTVPPSPPRTTGMQWAPMAEAPIAGRIGAGVVWTGNEMLVWGGVTRGGTPSEVSDGAAYDPTTDTWRTIAPAPDGLIGRPGIATAWTGDLAVFWAGNSPDGIAAGATYDPVADTWQAFDPGPLGPREGFTSAWTGSELVIIGGVRGDQVAEPVGAAFDPIARTWRSLPALDDHWGDLGSGVWTGREILRSGQRLLCPELGSACTEGEPFLAGYDPATDTYRDIALGPAGPSADAGLRPVGMAGTEAFFESGGDPAAGLISYDLTADAWAHGDPAPCEIDDDGYLQTVWLDERWVIPCGSEQLQIYDTGDRAWTVVEAGESPLNIRSGSQTAWTGTQLIMWSGAEPTTGTPTPNDGQILSIDTIDPIITAVPSQTPADALRDQVVAELAAMPYEDRVRPLVEERHDMGVWILSRIPDTPDGVKSGTIGPEDGSYPSEVIYPTEYGEILLVDQPGHISRAYPMPGAVPSWIHITADFVYAGHIGDGGLPSSTLVRIDLDTLIATVLVLPSPLLGGGEWPSTWHVGSPDHLKIYQTLVGFKPDGLTGTDASSWIGEVVIDVPGIDQLIDSLPPPGPPSLDDETLGLRGIGPIQIGASIAELAALGYEITYADCEVPYIPFGPNSLIALAKGSDTVTGLYVWFDPDNPDQSNSELRTDSGIGAGSTRAEVRAAYGDQVVERLVEIEDYNPDLVTVEDRIELIPSDPADDGLVMIFSFFDDDTLSGIRTGETSAVAEPNLCA